MKGLLCVSWPSERQLTSKLKSSSRTRKCKSMDGTMGSDLPAYVFLTLRRQDLETDVHDRQPNLRVTGLFLKLATYRNGQF